MLARLLVIDDDDMSRRLIHAIFRKSDYEIFDAADGPAGIDKVGEVRPSTVLLDLNLPGMHGFEVLEKLHALQPELSVVVTTGESDVKIAVEAMRRGAFDYVTKPIETEEFAIIVQRAVDAYRMQSELTSLRRQATGTLAAQMGPSPTVARLADQVRTVAKSDLTVLIVGETGTGKELIAQAVHRESARRDGPLIALDCGAIPEALLESELFGHEKGAFTGAERRREGRFKLAEKGTFFLDEVGNLPVALQAKLLRVLESREVTPVGSEKPSAMDVRFVAATNDDLKAHVSAGRFRSDLYFRLAQYTIALPPLRERRSDTPHLAQRFLEEASIALRKPVQKFVPEALDRLQAHAWPGNVRELRNVVRQAVLETEELVVRADLIARLLDTQSQPSEAIATAAAPAGSLKEIAARAARDAEHRAICETLRATAGNKSQAAKILRTDYKTLHLKMKLLGIESRTFAG